MEDNADTKEVVGFTGVMGLARRGSGEVVAGATRKLIWSWEKKKSCRRRRIES